MQLLALRDPSRDHKTNQNQFADLIAQAQLDNRQRSDLSQTLKLKTFELRLSQLQAERIGIFGDPRAAEADQATTRLFEQSTHTADQPLSTGPKHKARGHSTVDDRQPIQSSRPIGLHNSVIGTQLRN